MPYNWGLKRYTDKNGKKCKCFHCAVWRFTLWSQVIRTAQKNMNVSQNDRCLNSIKTIIKAISQNHTSLLHRFVRFNLNPNVEEMRYIKISATDTNITVKDYTKIVQSFPFSPISRQQKSFWNVTHAHSEDRTRMKTGNRRP